MSDSADRWGVERCDEHVHIPFDTPRRGLSSAVLNGGVCVADHYLNLRVSKHFNGDEPPEETLEQYAECAGWAGVTVGMMTAASMKSFRMVEASCQGIDLAVLVTSGLSNPRRAGDYADVRDIVIEQEPVGTINTIAFSASLTDAALVEALMIITEAKAAALQNASVQSPVSDLIATGTGTDSHGIFCGTGPVVGYCGKHVLFGEMLGRLTLEAVSASIAWGRY